MRPEKQKSECRKLISSKEIYKENCLHIHRSEKIHLKQQKVENQSKFTA